MPKNHLVFEPNFRQSSCLKNSSPVLIDLLLHFGFVNAAIYFNYKLGLLAEKIGHKTFDNLLTSEFESMQRFPSEMFP